MEPLTTQRLTIRPFLMAELEEVHRILDVELQWAGRLLTLEERRERLAYRIAQTSDQGVPPYGDRAIVLTSTGQLIGMTHFESMLLSAQERRTLGLEETGYTTVEINLGYALSPRFHRQGYAGEAVGAMLAYAFDTLRLGRVFVEISSDNQRSLRLAQRLGMTLTPCPRPGWEKRTMGVLHSK
jgi:RimJ/RimL family protein N-acetyltransferase